MLVFRTILHRLLYRLPLRAESIPLHRFLSPSLCFVFFISPTLFLPLFVKKFIRSSVPQISFKCLSLKCCRKGNRPTYSASDLLAFVAIRVRANQKQDAGESCCRYDDLCVWGSLGSAPPNRSARKQTILRLNNISNISARQLMEQEVSPNKQQYFNNKIKKPATTDIFERLYRKISPKSRIISGLGN